MKKIIASLLFFIASSGQAELIASYEMNGNSNDSSGNNLNATVFGATLTTDRFGNSDSAYYFDGINDYIQTGVVDSGAEFSYSVWFQADSLEGERSIVDSDIGGQWGRSLIIGYFNNDGDLDVQYHNGFIDREVSVSTSDWHHAVVTYTPTLINLFLDGVNVYEHSGTFASTDNGIFRIGRHNERDPQWFNGKIDDVSFYSSALTKEQVSSLYNATEVSEPAAFSFMALGLLIFLRTRKS